MNERMKALERVYVFKIRYTKIAKIKFTQIQRNTVERAILISNEINEVLVNV